LIIGLGLAFLLVLNCQEDGSWSQGGDEGKIVEPASPSLATDEQDSRFQLWGGEIVAVNRPGNFSAAFAGDTLLVSGELNGKSWSWTWRTTGVGRDGSCPRTPWRTPEFMVTESPDGQERARVRLSDGCFAELYESRASGLRQHFTIRSAEDGPGPLLLEAEIGGDLATEWTHSAADRLAFSLDNKNVLQYQSIIALDAEGAPLPIRWKMHGGSLWLSIDDREASYPVEVDLLLGAASELWVARYNGPVSGADEALAIAVDGQGNVIVAGPALNAATGFDYLTVKYDNDGAVLWAKWYNGPGDGPDTATAVQVDKVGNVYVTGSSWGGGGSELDYATIKYDADGNQQWVSRYAGAANNTDYALALALDAQGNVFVTGYSWGSGTEYDYATVKYDGDGVQQWANRYNSPANNLDKARAIALDASGNVFVTGVSIGVGSSKDCLTVAYDNDGGIIWVERFNGAANNDDEGFDLAVDGDDNVVVVGASVGSGVGWDYLTIKYDNGGARLWTMIYNGTASDVDYAHAVAIGGENDIYLTGSSWGAGGAHEDFVTIKYNPAGVQQWVARYDGPVADADIAYDLVVDVAENVYVVGESYGWGTNRDYATLKYNGDGELQWVARYNGPVNDHDMANAVAVDEQANVYVTGESLGRATGYDFTTIRYCGACYVGGECHADGTLNPTNPCEICLSAFSSVAWSENDGAACDDGAFCNGADTCLGRLCNVHTGDPCADNGVYCDGNEFCNETIDDCVSTGNPCPDDGLWCNGEEECNEGLQQCLHTGNPCPDDGLWCNGEEYCDDSLDQCRRIDVPACPDDGCFCNGEEFCDEDIDQCAHQNAPDCADNGLFCDGEEYCDEINDVCAATGNPCPDDLMFCTGVESCDETDDQCLQTGNPCPDNGLWCDGLEWCDEGNDRCLTTGDPCDEDEQCLEETDECVPLADDDTIDDDTIDDDTTDDDTIDDDSIDDDTIDDDSIDDDTIDDDTTDDDMIDDDTIDDDTTDDDMIDDDTIDDDTTDDDMIDDDSIDDDDDDDDCCGC